MNAHGMNLFIVDSDKALAERWDMCKSLSEISVPVLILCGREDTVTPVGESEFLHRNIANSTLHLIDRAGHLSNLEQPEEFNLHLAKFISELD
jgi:pimeloyl-ACP methyl ester carboxylesterase